MEDKTILNNVFILYLNIENHFRSYRTAKYALDKILKNQPKSHLVFIDAYDVCDLFYPKEVMKRDSHYDVINKLWLEFFALCKREEIPFNIQVVIPPAAAYEIIEFTYDHIRPLEDGFVPTKKTMKLEEFIDTLNKNWKEYIRIEPFLNKNKLGEIGEKFTSLYKDEKLVEFSKLIRKKTIFSEAKTMDDIIKQVGDEIDYKKGSESFNKRRPDRPFPNKTDMWNLVTCVAYIKSLHRNRKQEDLIFITSHSGHTLGGWNDSWNLKAFDSPVRASLSENILVTSLIKKKGDVEAARDFTVEGECSSRDITDGLQTIPQIEAYVKESDLEKRKQMRNKYSEERIEVKIPSRTLVEIEKWNEKFERTKIPKIKPTIEKELDYEIVVRLLKDEVYREELKEEASYNAKTLFSVLEQQGILDVNRVFIPEDPKSEEVLNWLREK